MTKNAPIFSITKRRLAALFGTALMLVGSASTLVTPMANAAALTATPQISFTFDDGLQSSYTKAAPTLAKYGLSGTNYVITNCIGMTTVPNTCAADNQGVYMTWAQVQALQNTYHWEIGSHTVDHGCMASDATVDPDDCTNTVPLTAAQLDAEMANSKQALLSNGITSVTDLAWPYGDYGNASLAAAAKYYATTRGFADDDANNAYPYNDLILHDQQFQSGAPTRTWAICPTMTVAGAESCIDGAITNKQWVVLVFHNISDTPGTATDSYDYSTADLDAIAAYAAAKQTAGLAKVVNPAQGLVTGTNLLPNGDFASGISGGWTTDDSANITADANNNGRYPEPTHSVLLKASVNGTTNGHLFSPNVSVSSANTYVLKNFVNVTGGTSITGADGSITDPSVNFYIDEFDANGNWISGVDTGAGKAYINCAVTVKCIDVADVNFTYTPSSATVASARLQIIIKGAGTTAYYDGAQWFAAGTAKTGDIDGNGVVNDDDATLMFANWGKTGASLTGDIDHNQVVNDDDATLLFANWSK